jgi:hypothetical protein
MMIKVMNRTSLNMVATKIPNEETKLRLIKAHFLNNTD